MAKQVGLGAIAVAALLASATAAGAQCTGDCNEDGAVAVNELVLGVNIALGAAELSVCSVFDSNGDEQVTVNELISGVNNALTGCPVPDLCGNGEIDDDEQCDDGNRFGGDGCAANCTNEVQATCVFGEGTVSTVQTTLFAIPLNPTGQQVLTGGQPRGADQLVPFVIRADEVQFDPIPVPGLVCACVRGAEVEEFGPGNTAAGQTGCGPNGLAEVDYLTTLDHNINDIDPTCQTGELEGPEDMHPGVCNGVRTFEFTGGGPRGSTFLNSVSGISLIQDGGLCEENCSIPAMGPDCLPCTDDDPDQAAPSPLPLTSGTAIGEVFDANNILGRNIARGVRCGATDCLVQATGTPVDCDLLASDPDAAIAGSSTVGALPAIDAAQIGDSVVTSIFVCE